MQRRRFIKNIAAGAMFAPIFARAMGPKAPPLTEMKPLLPCGEIPFKMKFSPRVGMKIFTASGGAKMLDRFEFYYANGFRSVEGMVQYMSNRELMDDCGRLVEKFGFEVGPQSSLNEKKFGTMSGNVVPPPKGSAEKPKQGAEEIRAYFREQLEKVFDMLDRIHGKSFIIGPGTEVEGLSYAQQMKNVIENSKYCTQLCEKRGAVMMIEPLNLQSHPGQFFTKCEQALEVCEAVDSPHCKILYDFFHEQMSCGNLDSLDSCWKHIGGFHIADAPAREEPGTGVIDYPALMKKVWDKGWRGTLGLEHKQSDPSAQGDVKLMQIYRNLDKQAI